MIRSDRSRSVPRYRLSAKASETLFGYVLDLSGRSERIRTSDPLNPIQVRSQAAPRSDGSDYSDGRPVVQ